MEAVRIYFASDLHLGAPDAASSLEREKLFVRWLNEVVRPNATELYIVGDLFDFWLEYKRVVPRGFVRVLGKLAELCDDGLPVHFFTGNHDLWVIDYFKEEIGMQVHTQPLRTKIGGKQFMIGHGDGLGPGDTGYKILKRYFFTSKLCQFLLRSMPPDWAVGLGSYLSRRSRLVNGEHDARFLGNEQEWLVQYARRKLETEAIDYFVFGHRHLPLTVELNEHSRYVNLGDWIKYNTYAIYDGNTLELQTFPENTPTDT